MLYKCHSVQCPLIDLCFNMSHDLRRRCRCPGFHQMSTDAIIASDATRYHRISPTPSTRPVPQMPPDATGGPGTTDAISPNDAVELNNYFIY